MPEGFLPTPSTGECLCVHAWSLYEQVPPLQGKVGDDLDINYEAMLESNAALESSL